MEYKCICGKEFKNSQAINAHKSHCKTYHMNRYGNLDKLMSTELHRSQKSIERNKRYFEAYNTNKLNQWVSEQHRCEKCGKVMTIKFGSGRFCDRRCANSHNISDNQKLKTSQTLRGRNLTDAEKYKILTKKPKQPKFVYNGPSLPHIEIPKQLAGYRIRNKFAISLPEMFWKTVLDNNKVSYIQEFIVQKPKGEIGVFRMDFLIGKYDIEIDGGTHKKLDVKSKDERRDRYLNSLGYMVYRIKWVNPNNDKNKEIVNNQINGLFETLNLSRIC